MEPNQQNKQATKLYITRDIEIMNKLTESEERGEDNNGGKKGRSSRNMYTENIQIHKIIYERGDITMDIS